MNNLTTEKGVLALMRTSKSDAEWNKNCLAVKNANSGMYPSFWFRLMLQSGEAALIINTYNNP